MNQFSWRVYTVAIAVAGFSFWVARQFSQNEWTAALTATPFSAALMTILVQIFRDNLELERKRILQRENNDFILSATSHMAIVAFDKHVEFAEKYVAEIHRSIGELISVGPNKHASGLAVKLHLIRLEFTVWETDAVSKTLNEFEHALQKIGAVADGVRDSVASPERSKKLEEVYDIFNKILGIEKKPEILSDEIIWTVVVQRMRELLGITQLTEIRQNYIKSAHRRSIIAIPQT